jgi:hypothetical protein
MAIPEAVRGLEGDLRNIFGARLQSLVIYQPASGATDVATPTMAIVDALTADDLRACASRVESWHDAGVATPLFVARREFAQALDAFPLEFGAILADHIIVSGPNPFDGLRVESSDLRRACEVQVRSHLLHLREGYIEARGRSDELAALISGSAASLAGLVRSVVRLHGAPAATSAEAAGVVERMAALTAGSLSSVVALVSGAPLSPDAARRMFPGYLAALQRLTEYVDSWSPS